jgi:hypothetical protein
MLHLRRRTHSRCLRLRSIVRAHIQPGANHRAHPHRFAGVNEFRHSEVHHLHVVGRFPKQRFHDLRQLTTLGALLELILGGLWTSSGGSGLTFWLRSSGRDCANPSRAVEDEQWLMGSRRCRDCSRRHYRDVRRLLAASMLDQGPPRPQFGVFTEKVMMRG